jgi:hypothetical protein
MTVAGTGCHHPPGRSSGQPSLSVRSPASTTSRAEDEISPSSLDSGEGPTGERQGGLETPQRAQRAQGPKPDEDPWPIPPAFISFSAGRARLAGTGPTSPGRGLALATGAGKRLSPRLDVLGDFGLSFVSDPSAPGRTQASLFLIASARYSPLRDDITRKQRGYDLSSFYLQSGIGYSELYREGLEDPRELKTVGRGIAVSAVVGWLPMQGADWSLGIEFGDRLFYNLSGGLRHNLVGVGIVQLHWVSRRTTKDPDRRDPDRR